MVSYKEARAPAGAGQIAVEMKAGSGATAEVADSDVVEVKVVGPCVVEVEVVGAGVVVVEVVGSGPTRS